MLTVLYYGTILPLMKLYSNQKKVLKKALESEKWAEIDFHYMTEESEGESDCINQHKLTWRSQG